MEPRPLTFLRADGNEDIATGHLARCLTIARALRDASAQPVFLVSDVESADLLVRRMTRAELQSKAFPILQLDSDYRDLTRELPTVCSLLAARRPRCMLVDSYFATDSYLQAVSRFCPTAYLDDLQSWGCPADLVINYDPGADASRYRNARRVMAGPAYAPLRDQFATRGYHAWETVRDLFLSTGGADPYNVSIGILGRLLDSADWERVRFHVLTGPFHEGRPWLLSLSEKDGRVIVHENVSDMAGLMAGCDLALSAGGTTLFELCCVGVPTVSFALSDSQLPCVGAFEQAMLIPCAGDARNGDPFLRGACELLRALAADYPKRREQSAHMRMTVDGAGAGRIAEALLELHH